MAAAAAYRSGRRWCEILIRIRLVVMIVHRALQIVRVHDDRLGTQDLDQPFRTKVSHRRPISAEIRDGIQRPLGANLVQNSGTDLLSAEGAEGFAAAVGLHPALQAHLAKQVAARLYAHALHSGVADLAGLKCTFDVGIQVELLPGHLCPAKSIANTVSTHPTTPHSPFTLQQ